jgi:hypothetical protein
MFFEKKGLRLLGVRPWICVFFIFYFILILFRWIKKQWVWLPFWFSKRWFLLFLWTCKLLLLYTVFSVPINIWEFFTPCFTTQVDLQFGTICPNMNRNINVNFHILGDGLISYTSMLNQIFIPWTSRKKTSLLFSMLWFHKRWRLRSSNFREC